MCHNSVGDPRVQRVKQKKKLSINKVSDVSAADRLPWTHAKNYDSFSNAEIQLFSVVEILMEYSSV